MNSQVAQSPLYEHCLESSSSILDKFGEVKEIFADEYPFYEEVKNKAEIEQKFFNYYVTKGNLDARELSIFESEEFYNALVSGNVAKIDEYTRTDLHEIHEIATEIYFTYEQEHNRKSEIEEEITADDKSKSENTLNEEPLSKDNPDGSDWSEEMEEEINASNVKTKDDKTEPEQTDEREVLKQDKNKNEVSSVEDPLEFLKIASSCMKVEQYADFYKVDAPPKTKSSSQTKPFYTVLFGLNLA